MSATRANLVCAMMGCACAVAHAGCMAPWAVPPAQVGASASQPAPLSDSAPPPTLGASKAGADGASSNMAGVLDKLQQVRAIDPAAEQKLIDELRRTPAESWPLVAEQFRASLAYREQLAAKIGQHQPPVEPGPAAVPPSDPIGALVDPRAADADEATIRARAQSMHYAMQAPLDAGEPPAEFTSDGPAYPIAEHHAPPAHKSWAADASKVQPAALETVGGRAVLEEQAIQLPAKQASAEQPPPADLDWQQLVEQATDELTARVAASPATTAEVHQHVSLRMLRLLAGDTESALAPIPNISPLEQDYWSRQLFALATYLDHHSQPDDKRRAAAAVTHLDEAVSHLREIGSLSLRNLSFCKSVYGYGAVEPYESDRFSPGNEVSLYVEVENYHSQSSEKGFCTLLGSTYELLDEDGQRVGGGEFPDVDDCCRSRRRDFHIQYGVTLPQAIPPGHYRLQLVVKDRQSDKIGNASVAFEIRGKQL